MVSAQRLMGLSLVIATVLLLRGSMSSADIVHEYWSRIGRARAGNVELLLAIKQTNVEWLESKLWAVSYPDSPDYGKYMNFDEIASVVHGKPESIRAVLQGFAGVGVSEEKFDFTIGRDFAVVVAPLAAVEKLFSAQFYGFEHIADPYNKIVRSEDFSFPLSLAGHLDFVWGISNFPRTNRVSPYVQVHSADASNTNVGTTPGSIARDYNITYVSSNPCNSQAIASFLGQYFNPDDLKQFQEQYDVPENPIAKVEGENKANDPGIEAELDVQYITATGRNVTTWFVSISRTANKNQEDFLYWITQQVNDTASPWVHSVSYGDCEVSIPTDYQSRTDMEFMKFGISGRSVFVSSGDEGVHCDNNKYVPEWPTCSPYVTSVGGTTSLSSVWSQGGGGFSNTFSIPAYQKDTVEAYLRSGKAPPTTYFSSTGRAYPDVSAFSVNFQICYQGNFLAVDGTSCSTPTFAGIVSSLNDVRLNDGKSTLGFLNPLLYQTLQGNGFFDITEGSNSGTGSCPGFDAIPGWDPASGWGSPNFGLLRDLVRNL